MRDQLRKLSGEELRETLLALARTKHTSDPNELASLVKAAGFDCSVEEITAIAREMPRELGDDQLEAVAGGTTVKKGYDFGQNVKL